MTTLSDGHGWREIAPGVRMADVVTEATCWCRPGCDVWNRCTRPAVVGTLLCDWCATHCLTSGRVVMVRPMLP